MTQEALKLALEVNESMKDVLKQVNELIAENKALKEALAQEQEPVVWVSEDVCEGQYIDGRPRKIWWECEKGVGTAFYTISPQRTWVDLTRTQMQDVYFEVLKEYRGGPQMDGQLAFGEALQAKIKEKNT